MDCSNTIELELRDEINEIDGKRDKEMIQKRRIKRIEKNRKEKYSRTGKF